MRNTFFAAPLAFCGMVAIANATPLDTVNTTDDVYGGFSGSIDSSATGGAAELTWKSAGYFWTGNIDLTTASGKIIADINTNGNDIYTLYGENSGYATIGTHCVAGGGTVCVVATGAPQILYSAVSSANGGFGMCCGDSDIIVTVVSDVPEPASLAIIASALTGIGVVRRRSI